ncbi:asialoglycoprotein receptor 1-like [Lithobates pipiens]
MFKSKVTWIMVQEQVVAKWSDKTERFRLIWEPWATLCNISLIPGVQPDSSDPLCSKGWMRYGLSCYSFSSSSRPWNVSKKDCEEREAHLIVINSEGEMNFLHGIASNRWAWIGLTDLDGTWKWVDGTPYDITPKFWEKGQPNDWMDDRYGGVEDCTLISPPHHEWNDAHCSLNSYYVCEKDIIL